MDPRQRELIEASRHDAADLGLSEAEALELRAMLADDPALAAELERVHAWDASVSSAFDDVEVPAGLTDRLRTVVDRELAPQPAASPASETSRPSRRRWIIGALASAAALLVGLGVWTVVTQPREVNVADVVSDAETYALDNVVWAVGPPPPGVVPAAIGVKVQRWGTLPTALDPGAIVLDLVKPGAPPAFVVVSKVPRITGNVPVSAGTPAPSSGGRSIVVWQSTSFVYTLVVEGHRERYRAFLRHSSPVAMNW